jgi:hypothetical protein
MDFESKKDGLFNMLSPLKLFNPACGGTELVHPVLNAYFMRRWDKLSEYFFEYGTQTFNST